MEDKLPGQAKIQSEAGITRLLKVAKSSRHPLRNAAIVRLSVRAGLRACQIAYLDWAMVTDGRGPISNVMSVPGTITKFGLARRLPIHAELKKVLVRLRCRNARQGAVIVSERSYAEGRHDPFISVATRPQAMTPKSIVNGITTACRMAELAGCSSHSRHSLSAYRDRRTEWLEGFLCYPSRSLIVYVNDENGTNWSVLDRIKGKRAAGTAEPKARPAPSPGFCRGSCKYSCSLKDSYFSCMQPIF